MNKEERHAQIIARLNNLELALKDIVAILKQQRSAFGGMSEQAYNPQPFPYQDQSQPPSLQSLVVPPEGPKGNIGPS